MDTKFVYGAYRNQKDRPWLETLGKAICEAHENGYSFVLFNDILYFVASKHEGYETPLRKSDIFAI